MSKTRSKTGRSAVIVLGMHRSGTSALAGVLGLLGCDTPASLMVPNENNEKGYFESSKLYNLHTDLFASAATRWDDWLPMPPGWFGGPRASEFHERAIETMNAEFGQSSFFLVKDPRICRLVPFWEGVLVEEEITPRYVLTHRNPLEVAASLHKRDGLSTGHGLLIWLRHVLEAEHGTRGQPRCFTSFVQLITNWAGVAEKIQTSLGLSLPRFSLGVAPEVDTFLEGSLRHHHEAPEKVLNNPMLSIWVRDTYEILERWVAGGEAPADHPRLDEIRAAFDASGPAFAEVIQSGRSRVESLSGELRTLIEERATAAVRIEELRVGVAAREETANKIRDEVAQAKAQIADLEAAAGTSEDAQSAELGKLRHRLSQELSALEQRSHEADETHKALKALQVELAERDLAHAELLRVHEESLEEAMGLREAVDAGETRAHEIFEREHLARISSEARVAALDNQLQTKFRELSELSRLLYQSEQALTAAQIQAQAELAKVQSKLRDEKSRVTKTRAQLASQKAEAQERERLLGEKILALRASNSWRLTQPLRSVVNWARGNRT